MNSRRMPPGASTNAMRRVPNGAADDPRPPEHLVAGQLGVEVVDEQRGVQEPLVRQRAGVLVDRPGEQGERQRRRAGRRPGGRSPTRPARSPWRPAASYQAQAASRSATLTARLARPVTAISAAACRTASRGPRR